jgi:Glycine/D-amino acid oxidases (deaminating)
MESHKLQAWVTEPNKPQLDQVVVFRGGGAHFYISQSEKGGIVRGGEMDWYKSYAQKGNLPTVQEVAEGAKPVLPGISRLKLLRHWSGIMEKTKDGTFVSSKTPGKNREPKAGGN